MPIKWIIFDCDGVLLDTESVYTEIATSMIERYSELEDPQHKQVDTHFKSKVMGSSKAVAMRMMIDTFQLRVSEEEYLEVNSHLEFQSFSSCRLMPGAEEAIAEVERLGIPFALATSTGQKLFAHKSASHSKLFSPFHAIVVGDDPAVGRGKPAPDIFLEAARRINATDMESCLVVEDSPNGVLGALAAGMQVVWIPDGDIRRAGKHSELIANPNVTVLESLHELVNFLPSLVINQ